MATSDNLKFIILGVVFCVIFCVFLVLVLKFTRKTPKTEAPKIEAPKPHVPTSDPFMDNYYTLHDTADFTFPDANYLREEQDKVTERISRLKAQRLKS